MINFFLNDLITYSPEILGGKKDLWEVLPETYIGVVQEEGRDDLF